MVKSTKMFNVIFLTVITVAATVIVSNRVMAESVERTAQATSKRVAVFNLLKESRYLYAISSDDSRLEEFQEYDAEVLQRCVDELVKELSAHNAEDVPIIKGLVAFSKSRNNRLFNENLKALITALETYLMNT